MPEHRELEGNHLCKRIVRPPFPGTYSYWESMYQASFCPYTLREVSVLSELTFGHLRYSLTNVPPQSNSLPVTVISRSLVSLLVKNFSQTHRNPLTQTYTYSEAGQGPPWRVPLTKPTNTYTPMRVDDGQNYITQCYPYTFNNKFTYMFKYM